MSMPMSGRVSIRVSIITNSIRIRGIMCSRIIRIRFRARTSRTMI